jgi:1-acyl-sn-glycerol-3-phosphate acyltransferase
MLPPTPIRRLLLVPLVVVIACALAALTPAVALLTAAFNLISRRTRPERPRHSRLLRVTFLGLAWSAGETAALTVSLCLWLVSGFGGRLDTEPYQARNYAVIKWFLDLIYRAAGRACGLSVTVAGPPEASPCDDRPLIVLSRHAGPGDSLLLIHYLLSVCERRPRVVMKATLQLDPSMDILANRVPNAFLHPAKAKRAKAGEAGSRPNPGFRTGAAGSHHVDQIRRLAVGLDGGSALAIFPEGGNWTPHRWRRAIDRLRRGGRPDLAERAAAMPNVLPPHASGALAAIEACPAADVIFVAHTGLDRLVSVRDVWRGLRADMEIRARWWRVPAASVPRAVSREAQLTWLYDWWQRIDAWITAENSSPPPAQRPAEPVQPERGPAAQEPAAQAPSAPASAAPGPADHGGPRARPAAT